MTEYSDVYALASERIPEIIQTFIAHFVPENSTSDRQYEYSLRATDRSLAYCGHDFSRFVSLACTDGALDGGARVYEPGSIQTGGWVYFNDDASLVLGLTVRATEAYMAQKISPFARATAWSEHPATRGASEPWVARGELWVARTTAPNSTNCREPSPSSRSWSPPRGLRYQFGTR